MKWRKIILILTLIIILGGIAFGIVIHFDKIEQEKQYQIKIKSIVEKEIYASKSKEYKEMYKVIENKNVTFYDKKISKKYYFSKDLSLIKEIKGW